MNAGCSKDSFRSNSCLDNDSRYDDADSEQTQVLVPKGHSQWATTNNKEFIGVGATSKILPPGSYMIMVDERNLIFSQFEMGITDLIRFPDTVSDEVIDQIQKFWERKERFTKYKLPHRRGILLCGSAGCGKSCSLRLVCSDVIARGGIVIPYSDPGLMIDGLRQLREIQPETPVVILMEDLEAIMNRGSKSDTLNVLDGVYSESIQNVVFLATTNYPEELERRVTNRPSRFDRVFVVGPPSAASRKLYLETLGEWDSPIISIDQVIEETEFFSFAHLKELFTSVMVFDKTYESVLSELKAMIENHLPTGHDLEYSPVKGKLGFGSE